MVKCPIEEQSILDLLEDSRRWHAECMRLPFLRDICRVLALGRIAEGFRHRGWHAHQLQFGRLSILFVVQHRNDLRECRIRERRLRPYRQ